MSASAPDRYLVGVRDSLRVLVASDDPDVRRELVDVTERTAGLSLAAAPCALVDARRLLERREADVAVIDVGPDGGGFDLLEDAKGLPGRAPAFVVASTRAEHAVRAFAVRAAGFVLFPLDPPRYSSAVHGASSPPHAPGPVERAPHAAGPRYRERFVVRQGRRAFSVPVGEVRYLEAWGDYVLLRTATGQFMVRDRMKALENVLDPAAFVRIHRGTIVNLAHVVALRATTGGEWDVVLGGGVALRLSRRFRHARVALLAASSGR